MPPLPDEPLMPAPLPEAPPDAPLLPEELPMPESVLPPPDAPLLPVLPVPLLLELAPDFFDEVPDEPDVPPLPEPDDPLMPDALLPDEPDEPLEPMPPVPAPPLLWAIAEPAIITAETRTAIDNAFISCSLSSFENKILPAQDNSPKQNRK
jgi:hypothetical protein